MHYLIHGIHDYAIVENDAQAAKYLAAGWERASWADVRARWRAKDTRALDAMRAAVVPVARPAAQAVGLPRGWKLYHV